MWKKIFAIFLTCISGVPLFYLGELIDINEAIRAMILSFLYITYYFVVIKKIKIEEIDLIVSKVTMQFRNKFIREGL